MVDKETGEAITCDVAKLNQQRNLTEGCGLCQMCRELAYQSSGEKATTTWCVQAEGEPCDAAYKSPICIDPDVRMFPILAAKLLPYMYKTFRQHCLSSSQMTWSQQHRCGQAPDEKGGAALKCPMRNQTHPEGIGWDGKEESCVSVGKCRKDGTVVDATDEADCENRAKGVWGGPCSPLLPFAWLVVTSRAFL